MTLELLVYERTQRQHFLGVYNNTLNFVIRFCYAVMIDNTA